LEKCIAFSGNRLKKIFQALIYRVFVDSSPFDISQLACLLWLFPIFAQLPYNRCFLRKSIAKKTQTKPHDTLRCREEETLPDLTEPYSSHLAKPRPTLPHLATPWDSRYSRSPNNGKKGKKPGRVAIWGTWIYRRPENPKTKDVCYKFSVEWVRRKNQTDREGI